MEENTQEAYELEDVEVVTVGLVSRGMSGKKFLLFKSDTGAGGDTVSVDAPIASQDEQVSALYQPNSAEMEGENTLQVSKSFWSRVKELVIKLVKSELDEQPEIEQPDIEKAKQEDEPACKAESEDEDEDESEDEATQPSDESEESSTDNDEEDGDTEEKSGMSKKSTPHVEIVEPAGTMEVTHMDENLEKGLTPEFSARLSLIEKENSDLKARLEKAEKEAAEAREARERQVYIAKAREYTALPVAPDELANHLYWLSKQDESKAAWLMSVLEAVNAQMNDSELFVEKGTSKSVSAHDLTLVEKADAMVKAGKAENFKEALLQISNSEAVRYLAERRKELKEA